MRDAALAYLKRGWSIVPAHTAIDGRCSCRQDDCDSPGKHPRVKWQAYQQRRATESEVLTWWRRWPDANIAVITGAISGLVVLDVDPRHGGEESVEALQPLPDTLVCLTGGGGQHLYFAHPGRATPNGANLLPGIDIRGDGGYVIAPPSLHVSGRRYEWEGGSDEPGIPTGDDLAPVPDSLLSRLVEYRRSINVPIDGKPKRFDLESLMAMGHVPEGQRNVTLTRVAGHYAGQGKSLPEVAQMTMAANRALCDPELSAEEVRRIVSSIFVREERKQEVEQATREMLEGRVQAADGMGNEERIDVAASLWRRVGVQAVTDWYLLRGDTADYVLVTPEDEVRLGDDLLAYPAIRKTILRDLGVLLPPIAAKNRPDQWDPLAKLLRRVAREEVIEATRASERIEEWIEAYQEFYNPQEVPADQRRDALASGPILVDGILHLRPPRLAQFIEVQFGERIGPSELRKLLKRAGWEAGTVWCGKTTARAWRQSKDSAAECKDSTSDVNDAQQK